MKTEKYTNIAWSKMEDLQFHNTRTDYETGVTYTYAAETNLVNKEGNRIAGIERWGSRGFGSLYIVWIFDNTKKESQPYEFTNTNLKECKAFAIDKIQEKEEKPKKAISLLDHMKSGQYLFLQEVIQYINEHYTGKINTEIQGSSNDPALRITAYKDDQRTEISFFFYPTSFTSVDVHLFVDRALYIEDNSWLDDLAHSHKETMTVMPCDLIPHEIGAKLLQYL